MPEMPPAPSALEASERALRSRRLVQISTLTIAGLAVIALRALVTGNWSDAAIVGAGITTMLLCQSMNRRGATESAKVSDGEAVRMSTHGTASGSLSSTEEQPASSNPADTAGVTPPPAPGRHRDSPERSPPVARPAAGAIRDCPRRSAA